MPANEADVIIVGAGLSGLAAALHLGRAGYRCTLLDAADAVGGRIRTDHLDGYLLDCGFQIWLTAYPESDALLDSAALGFRSFIPGARVWTGTGFDLLTDPRRDRSASRLWSTATSTLLSPLDKLRALRAVWPLLQGHADALLPPHLNSASTDPDRHSDATSRSIPHARDGVVSAPSPPAHYPQSPKPDPRQLSTLEWLRSSGFSERSIRRFWRPFLAGVLLENELTTAAGFTMFTLRMFATGQAALPAAGMQSIPEQLAAKLQLATLRLGQRVVDVTSHPGQVLLSSGQRLRARAVIIATDQHAARALLPGQTHEETPHEQTAHEQTPPEQTRPPGKSTACLYFSAATPPSAAPILMLDGQGAGPINTVVVPSIIQPAYAPPGRHLISLSTVGLPNLSDDALLTASLRQMRQWFGPQVSAWRHLRTYRIPAALPSAPATSRPDRRPHPFSAPALFQAGDSLHSPSSNGALSSGRHAADAVLRWLRQ